MTWRKGKLKKEEFDKKCLCGHAKSSHHPDCSYCADTCDYYEPQSPSPTEKGE